MMAQTIEQVPYFLNRNDYDSCTFDRSQKEPIEDALPRAFPKRLASTMGWDGEDISLGHSVGSGTPDLSAAS